MKPTNRIPKIIHWCWLSGEPVPPFLQECMASWKRRLPEYTIRCWTQEDFDIRSVAWVEEAVAHGKWAFAADYIRLYALYTHGGIYLDSDVEVLRSFDGLLAYDFFSASEYNPARYKRSDVPVDSRGIPFDRDAFVPGYGIQAAIMGAAKGDPFVGECMEYYEKHHFRMPDGSLRTDSTMPLVMAKIAERHGFRYLDRNQLLEGGGIFIGRHSLLPSFIPLLRLRTIAFHHCAGSWLDPHDRPIRRTIGNRRLFLIAKYAAKLRWWRWRKKFIGNENS